MSEAYCNLELVLIKSKWKNMPHNTRTCLDRAREDGETGHMPIYARQKNQHCNAIYVCSYLQTIYVRSYLQTGHLLYTLEME